MNSKVLKVAEISPIAMSGSWIFSLVSTVSFVLAVHLDPEKVEKHLSMLWPPVLMILWLLVGSRLISKAHSVASKYQEQAITLMGRKGGFAIWEHQTTWMRARRALWLSIPFATMGLTITLLINTAWYWNVSWALVVCPTFYYAGYGMWGSWVVTRGVASLSQDALKENKLNVFHADHLAGLGFVEKYADVATMFMLSGATALPMGVMLGEKSMAMRTPLGYALSALVALAILAWGVFALSASLLGRSAIVAAIIQHRDPLLSEIANKKKEIIRSGENMKQLEALDIQEEAASHLRTGVFTGAGAWKDLFNVVAVGFALFDYVQELQKIV